MPPCNGRDYRVPQNTGPCLGCPYMTYQTPFISPPIGADASPSPSRMEYLMLPWLGMDLMERNVNALAKEQGWRIICTVPNGLILERPLDTIRSKAEEV
jgi:hypothetical protein